MNISAQLLQKLGVAGAQIERVITITQGQVILINESIADSVTDQLVALALDISQLVAFAIVATGGDMTMETNNGTTPDDTLNLLDGKPVSWWNQYLADHFTADIDGVYMTNSSGGASLLEGVFVFDPTL